MRILATGHWFPGTECWSQGTGGLILDTAYWRLEKTAYGASLRAHGIGTSFFFR